MRLLRNEGRTGLRNGSPEHVGTARGRNKKRRLNMRTGTIRKLICLVLAALIMGLAGGAVAEDGERAVLIDRTKDPSVQYEFPDRADILEIVYPRCFEADCCVLRQGDTVMMIDSGTKAIAEDGVIKALRAMGISHVDIGFNTHFHGDHIGGFIPLLEAGISFGEFCICQDEGFESWPRATMERMRESGATVRRMEDEDVLEVGKAEVHVFLRHRTDFTLNDYSGITMAEFGKFRFLSTGDIEQRGEEMFLKVPPSTGYRADLYKHAHHGYLTTKPELLDAIDPQMCVITGVRGSFEKAAQRLERHGIPWIRPWPEALRILTDGETWVLEYYEY